MLLSCAPANVPHSMSHIVNMPVTVVAAAATERFPATFGRYSFTRTKTTGDQTDNPTRPFITLIQPKLILVVR